MGKFKEVYETLIKEEKVDVKKIIKDLGDINWGDNNEKQMKAVQLLKGIALSEEDISNKFMKALSNASTKIADDILNK